MTSDGPIVGDPDIWYVEHLDDPKYDFLRCNEGKKARIVYKVCDCILKPWVMVAKSALLQSICLDGYGLYAMKNFKARRKTTIGYTKPEVIGTYGGIVRAVYTGKEEDDKEQERNINKLVTRDKRDSMLLMKNVLGHTGWSVVDGGHEYEQPPFLNRMNNPRKTNIRTNVKFNENGGVEVTQYITGIEFDELTTLDSIAKSEILIGYGSYYWPKESQTSKTSASSTYASHDLEFDLDHCVLPSLTALKL